MSMGQLTQWVKATLVTSTLLQHRQDLWKPRIRWTVFAHVPAALLTVHQLKRGQQGLEYRGTSYPTYSIDSNRILTANDTEVQKPLYHSSLKHDSWRKGSKESWAGCPLNFCIWWINIGTSKTIILIYWSDRWRKSHNLAKLCPQLLAPKPQHLVPKATQAEGTRAGPEGEGRPARPQPHRSPRSGSDGAWGQSASFLVMKGIAW